MSWSLFFLSLCKSISSSSILAFFSRLPLLPSCSLDLSFSRPSLSFSDLLHPLEPKANAIFFKERSELEIGHKDSKWSPSNMLEMTHWVINTVEAIIHHDPILFVSSGLRSHLSSSITTLGVWSYAIMTRHILKQITLTWLLAPRAQLSTVMYSWTQNMFRWETWWEHLCFWEGLN